jgi:2-polyprenyl-6-methoxyphenol hydroxylase-like FAD-dependent oxidoreductase
MYIVINGGGKVGSYLARTMVDSGHDVALIEKRAEIVEKLVNELPGRVLVIHGDGCDATYQEDAGWVGQRSSRPRPETMTITSSPASSPRSHSASRERLRV